MGGKGASANRWGYIHRRAATCSLPGDTAFRVGGRGSVADVGGSCASATGWAYTSRRLTAFEIAGQAGNDICQVGHDAGNAKNLPISAKTKARAPILQPFLADNFVCSLNCRVRSGHTNWNTTIPAKMRDCRSSRQ